MINKDTTIKSFHKDLMDGKFSAVEATKYFFDEIRKQDGDLGAYLEIWEEEALKEAEEADRGIKNGEDVDVLTGVPLAIKDNILIRGRESTSASKILEGHIAEYDSTVIGKLKSRGSVFLGRTNMDEFAMGGSTELSAFKVTRNPHDTARVPGGSSGGTAAAVASGMALGGLGSDTGGSVRQPAGFCGLVGLRPTYGAVSRYGLMAAASSFDQIGPLTKTVEDNALLFSAMVGKDRFDSSSYDHKYNNDIENSVVNPDVKGMTFGIVKELWDEDKNTFKGVDEETARQMNKAKEKFEKLGARFVKVDMPSVDYALATYYISIFAEESSNLARFDGLRYGKDQGAGTLEEVYKANKSKGFGEEVKRRIILGTFVLSSGFYDAYYGKASQIRRVMKKDIDKAFEGVDALFIPIAPTVAFKIGENIEDPLAMYYGDMFTVLASLTGSPALSVPTEKYEVGSGVMPVGFQLIGKDYDEATLFEAGSAYEGSIG